MAALDVYERRGLRGSRERHLSKPGSWLGVVIAEGGVLLLGDPANLHESAFCIHLDLGYHPGEMEVCPNECWRVAYICDV